MGPAGFSGMLDISALSDFFHLPQWRTIASSNADVLNHIVAHMLSSLIPHTTA